MSKMFRYCGWCYSIDESWEKPHGFCRLCWKENGYPRPMNWNLERWEEEKRKVDIVDHP